jgi:ABC-type molybdate transport system ATPase subunit
MMLNNLLGEIIGSKWFVNNQLMHMQFNIQQLFTETKKVWMKKNMRIQ